jgi:uncharacterized protein (DUF2225 family)
MTTIVPIDLTCPVCGDTFKSKTVGTFSSKSIRTDFRPNYLGENPVPLFFHACPNCGFCGDLNNYKMKIENNDLKAEIKDMPSLTNTSSSPTLTSKIARAVRCLEKIKQYKIKAINELTLANKWIMAYWWAENPEDKRKYGEITLNYLKQAFKKNLISEKLVLRYKYLQGEINRRIGNKEKANFYFDKTIELSEKFPDPKDLATIAQQQKDEPKERF